MRTLSLLFAAAVLAACESRPPRLTPGEGDGGTPAAPAPTTMEDLRPFLGNRAKDYPLYAGDEIRILVQGHDELTIERKIPSEGKIPLYGVGAEDGAPVTVVAAGKRIPDLEAELRGHYARNYTNPYVTVRVVGYAPKTIYVAGAVVNPKDYQLPNEERVSLVQALTMAGWFTESAAPDRIRVIRRDPVSGDRTYLPPIDVGRIVSGGQVEMDILLDPGDTITVDSKASQSVFVFGFVENQGEVAWSSGMTLTRLITRAGGLKEYAKLTNIRVLRNVGRAEPQVFLVDLKKVFDGQAPDFPIAPGDVVHVDETFF